MGTIGEEPLATNPEHFETFSNAGAVAVIPALRALYPSCDDDAMPAAGDVAFL